jgi:tetratricopeptide (TPR) repeat protein
VAENASTPRTPGLSVSVVSWRAAALTLLLTACVARAEPAVFALPEGAWLLSLEQRVGDAVFSVEAGPRTLVVDHPTGEAGIDCVVLIAGEDGLDVRITARGRRGDVPVTYALEALPDAAGRAFESLNAAAARYAASGDAADVYSTYEALLAVPRAPPALHRFLVRAGARSAMAMRRPGHAQALMEGFGEGCEPLCWQDALLRAQIAFELDRYTSATEQYAAAFADEVRESDSPAVALEYAIASGPYALAAALSGSPEASMDILADGEGPVFATRDPGIVAPFVAMQSAVNAFLGNMAEAERLQWQAQALYEAAGDLHGVAETWIELSTTWRVMGRYLEAIDAGQTALSVISRLKKPDALVGPAYHRLAEIYRLLGDFHRTRRFLQRAYDEEVATGRQARAVSLLRQLGTARRQSGDPAGALDAHVRALEGLDVITQPWRASDLHREIALDHLALGDSAAARREMETAWEKRQDAHGRADRYGLIADRARVIRGDGQPALAASFLGPYWGSRDALPAAAFLRIGHELLLSELHSGSYDRSIETGVLMIDRLERELAALEPDRLAPAWAGQVNPVYADLAAAWLEKALRLGQQSFAERAFETVLRGQALALRRQYRARERVRNDEVARLQRDLAAIANQRALTRADSDTDRQLARQAFEIIERIAALEEAPAAAPGLTPPTLDALRDQLPPRTTALHYFCAQRRCWAFAMSREDFEVVPIDAVRLREARTRLDAMAGQPPTPDLIASFGDILLGPVRIAPGTDRLAVSADFPVERVPFAALPLPSGGVVIDAYSVVRMPSLFAFDTTAGPLSLERVTVFADPEFSVASTLPGADSQAVTSWSRSLPRLHWSREEAQRMRRLYGASARILIGENATATNLLARESLRSNVLHIATHAYFDDARPGLVGLAVTPAPDGGAGFVTLDQLLYRPVPADLVVLSGCETGRGVYVPGEGQISLARAFHARGARRVVSTRWPVADHAAAAFMERLHEAIHRGIRPADAVRQAQLALKEIRQYHAPAHWAGYTVSSIVY